MFSLTIVFGPRASTWVLMFKTREAAEIARSNVHIQDYSRVTDDFGQEAMLAKGIIHGVMLEDLELSKQVHIETSLHQARIMATAQATAMQDPVLKQKPQIARGGPAMISPRF